MTAQQFANPSLRGNPKIIPKMSIVYVPSPWSQIGHRAKMQCSILCLLPDTVTTNPILLHCWLYSVLQSVTPCNSLPSLSVALPTPCHRLDPFKVSGCYTWVRKSHQSLNELLLNYLDLLNNLPYIRTVETLYILLKTHLFTTSRWMRN